jgi:hypothetical protein
MRRGPPLRDVFPFSFLCSLRLFAAISFPFPLSPFHLSRFPSLALICIHLLRALHSPASAGRRRVNLLPVAP